MGEPIHQLVWNVDCNTSVSVLFHLWSSWYSTRDFISKWLLACAKCALKATTKKHEKPFFPFNWKYTEMKLYQK